MRRTLPEKWYASPQPLPHRWMWQKVPGSRRHWIAESFRSGLMAEISPTHGGWVVTVGTAIRPRLLHGQLLLGQLVTVSGFDKRQEAIHAAERAAVAAGVALERH